MTTDNARTVANVILGAAALGVAYYVLTTPPLRRRVWRAALGAATTALPAWIAREVQQAWAATERRAIS